MTDRATRVPVALVGFGGAGSGIHAPLIASNDRVELAVIVSRGGERRQAAAERYPGVDVSESLDAVSECEVVVVALPVAYRGGIVEELLSRGLRVVIEKPFAADLEAGRNLAEHAPELLTVFHNRRWDSDFLTLHRLKSESAWTGPVRLTSRIQRWQPSVRPTWRNDAAGGGFLREVGPHQIDQALTLLGPVVEVYAEVGIRRETAAAEDEVFISLTHLDGSVSHLVTGALGNPELPRFDLASSTALVTIGTGDPQQDQLGQGLTPRDDAWGFPDARGWGIRRGDSDLEALQPERGWWPAFYDAVADWTLGAEPPVSPADAVATLAVIHAARRSAAERRVVRMDES